MSQFNLEFILNAINGDLIAKNQELFNGVGTDTRTDLTDQLFIALKGENFDANQFLSKAAEMGAAGIIFDNETEDYIKNKKSLSEKVTLIKVKDSLKALHQLANAYRHRLNAIVVGIAGSNGKTTSKEFTAHLISNFRKVHYSKGSFNNHWGVPFSILSAPEDTEVLILEMGMNHKGELSILAKIADANIVVCTYVAVEHIEHFGTLEKIAEAESEIYQDSPKNSVRIFNLDNEYTAKMFEPYKTVDKDFIQVFAKDSSKLKDLTFKSISLKTVKSGIDFLEVQGNINHIQGSAIVPVFGKHNDTNIMVAASIGLAVGLTEEQIWSGLTFCKSNWGRNQLLDTESKARILFDGYNSNPDSMYALLNNTKDIEIHGKKIGVFAEMKELGDLSPKLHEEVGYEVGKSGFDLIWFYGNYYENFKKGIERSGYAKTVYFSSSFEEEISDKITKTLMKDDMVFVKGSRGLRLEQFVKRCHPINFNEK